ncbi:MAG: DUF1285 domain-containing protein [Deltaproteobacteria bacterium]|nr:DUF1285 domain-containing protein [Deltaproteobacteria bacterium]
MTAKGINDLPPCLIHIDKEGHWHHKGVKMIRRDFIQMFYENMEMDSLGNYVITWGGERCHVDVEDTAFVVRNVVYQEATEGQDARFILFLSDDSQEDLVAATYYRLASHVKEENDIFYLPLNGRRYEIKELSE